MKIRESANFTDEYHNYVISIEQILDTNIPQLHAALTSQITGSSSMQSKTASSTLSAASKTQWPGDVSAAAFFFVILFVTMVVIGTYFVTLKRNREPRRPIGLNCTFGKALAVVVDFSL